MENTYKLYEDNAGGLHLAILDPTDACIYYLTSLERALVLSALEDFKSGSDPVEDGWDGGEADPQLAYQEINGFVDAHNGGAWEVEDDA